ncbi:hypothetical protein [Burkholderia pseudomallei]|uniref:hypothetical protein n=1 Tax=Burkholderia pseudomallei TaxID=28450 RepID=UPI000B20F653|nr:hypothetical protein [Burkholderia pseudomallei]
MSTNVRPFPNTKPGRPVDSSGSGGDDGGMETRIQELEKATTDIRERLARMESGLAHVATKADVMSVKTDVMSMEGTLLKWFIGTAIALAGLAFAAAKLIH